MKPAKNKEDVLINVFDINDLKYWCRKFKCDKDDLINAVLTVGKSASIVSDYLELNRKKRK